MQNLAMNSKIPYMIVKDFRKREYYKDRSYRWGVCFDGSEISKKALKQACAMMQPHDKCVIITVQEELVNSKTVHADLDALVAEYGISNIEKKLLPHPKGVSVYKTIQGFLM